MKTLYLVHENKEYYEGGITPWLVCTTQKQAEAAKQKICDFRARVYARFERMPDPFEDDITEAEYSKRYKAREDMLARVRWPYKIDMSFNMRDGDYTVTIRPIPFEERSL